MVNEEKKLSQEEAKLKYLWAVFAISIFFVRIYFPVHYLSDILFGAVLGYFIGHVICNFHLKKRNRREQKINKGHLSDK